jgi:hypothetical protein
MAPTQIGLFNKEYFDFLNFINKYLNDKTFKSFYRKNQIMKETNPKIFIKTWYDRIGSKYHEQVIKRDISFFLNKSYEEDISDTGETNTLLKYIDQFKQSYETLDENIKEIFLNYIINLTDKSFVYYNLKTYKNL